MFGAGARAFYSLIVLGLLWPAQARGQEYRQSVALPIKVAIIDFESTKALCASSSPPHWCPAHLLQVAGAESSSEEEDFIYSGTSELDRAEFAKRNRINAVKQRLALERSQKRGP